MEQLKPPSDEKPSIPLVSFILMGVSQLGTIAFVLFSILARKRYGKFFEERGLRADLPLTAQFFLDVPAPLYAAVFILLMAALLVKEIAIDRKSITLRLNLAALAGLVGLYVLWLMAVRWPALRIEQASP